MARARPVFRSTARSSLRLSIEASVSEKMPRPPKGRTGLAAAESPPAAGPCGSLATFLGTASNHQRSHQDCGATQSDKDQRTTFVPTSLPVLPVSAVTGEGLEQLERAVAALFPLPEVPAGEILTNARQKEAVGRAVEAIKAALEAMEAGLTPDLVLTETEGAMQALGELTGRTVREDVTERIFERFCVGK